jgi:hypothetical protein
MTGRALALFALGLSPAAAAAEGTAVRTNERLILEYHLDNGNRDETDDHYGTLIERLTVTGSAENLTTGADVNGEAFYSTDDDRHVNNARLERMFAEYTLGDVTLTAGDFHKQLGRGIVLSLRKVDELGLDTTLQGGRVLWAPDDHEFEVFAGRTNVSGYDAPTQFFVPEASDVMAGGSYTFRGLGFMNLGTYAYTQRLRVPLSRRGGLRPHQRLGRFRRVPGRPRRPGHLRRGRLAGPQERRPAHPGQSLLQHARPEPGRLQRPRRGPAHRRRQGAGQRRRPAAPIVFEYAQPPTLERIDQEFEPNTDVRGARLRLAYAFPGRRPVTPYVSADAAAERARGRANRSTSSTATAASRRLYRRTAASRLHLSGGYRAPHGSAARPRSP